MGGAVFFTHAWYSFHVASKTPKRAGAPHASSHKLLSTAGLFVMGLLVVASFVFTAFLASPGLLSTQFAAVVTSRLVSLTNDDRSSSGLGTLTVNPTLVAAAQAKANDMAEKGYFAHVSPDGRNSWTWFKDAGYSFSYAGENLAVDFTDSGDVNQAWLNSPTHRANIMNGHFTEIGIATAVGEYEGHKTTFVVQMFGTPAATAARAKVITVSSPQNPQEVALAKTEPAQEVLGTSAGPAPAAKPRTVAVAPAQSQTTGAAAVKKEPVIAETAPAHTPSGASSLLGSPRQLLEYLYILFGIILLIALAVRTRLEFKLHHTRHIFAVLCLMVIMGGFFVAADRYIFVPPVIGQGVAQ